MTDTRDFIERIGRRRAMNRLAISDQSMTNAIKRGLPAKYYAALRELADEVGEECPPELFKMAGFEAHEGDGTPAASSKSGDAA